MPPSSKVIISDTSCLILLYKINEIELLSRFTNKVYITEIVKKEFGLPIPYTFQIKNPTIENHQKILNYDIDEGEASALALTLETEDSILIIDDFKGRKIAEKLNINYSGTLGLILKSKQYGLIPKIEPIIKKILDTNFRINPELIDFILKEAGE